MRRSSRGSTMIASLLLIAMLLVGGLGLLGRKSVELKRMQVDQMAAQALLLARSGLQETLMKYGKDLYFPPPPAADQPLFSYSEEVFRSDGTTPVGRFQVTIDNTYRPRPYSIAIITSTGTVGPENEPLARRTIRAELDLDKSRATYFKLVNYQDLGGL